LTGVEVYQEAPGSHHGKIN